MSWDNPAKLVKCKKCGGEAYENFDSYDDLNVVAYAIIDCGSCDNQSECFKLPYSLMANEEAGSLTERLAVLDWNITNK